MAAALGLFELDGDEADDPVDPQAGEGISVKDIPEDVLNKCFQQSGAAK